MEEKNIERKTRMQRRYDKKYLYKRLFSVYVIILIILYVVYIVYDMYKENSIQMIADEAEYEVEKTEFDVDISSNKIPIPLTSFERVDFEYEGYTVDSRLECEIIGLKTNVLTSYSDNGLDLCASKYYGPEPNEVGNYIIAGHNYNKENMFNNLINLEINDEITLTDNINGEVKYRVYQIYKTTPDNIAPLSQNTNGKKEVTLITCVNYSKNRLVVKAMEN